jgi:hypothetical protein
MWHSYEQLQLSNSNHAYCCPIVMRRY